MQEDLFPNVQADEIRRLTIDEMFSEETCAKIIDVTDIAESKRLEGLYNAQAQRLHIAKDFKDFLRAYKMKISAARGINKGRKTEFIDQPIQLNCGEWICDVSGVRKNIYKIDSQAPEVKFASPIPILITEILENVDETTEKIRIAFFKNGWKTIICNRSTAASNTKIIELADKGLEVNSNNAKLLVEYIADLIALNIDIIPRYKAVSKMGWIDSGEFMPYADFKFDGDEEYKHLYNGITSKGDYNSWVDYTHELRKNIYLRMQMAASFASPILSKVGVLPFIFHLWGGTESGKTVGMMVAMSIWGNPKMGKLVRTMNMTVNAMMTTASFLNNIPFAGDELQAIKSQLGYDSLIMRVCEGIGRDRMKYNTIEKAQTWNCVFLFTGEENCVRENSGAGTINRVVSIECKNKIVENGNAVVNFINENYGFAGEKFVNYIKDVDLKSIYNNCFKQIIENSDVSDKQAMAAACILTADKMACECIYADEQPLDVNDILPFLTTKKDVDVSQRAFEFVINLVALNENRFTDNSTGEIWGRIDECSVLINKEILVREMRNNNFEFDAVKSKWAEEGLLIKNSVGRLAHQTKCYGINASYVKLSIRQDKENFPF